MFDISSLKTGDILLFSSKLYWSPLSIFGKLIEIFTNSPYSHIGMILKDPTWIKPELKGIYLWQSSYEGLKIKDPQDNKVKVGVELTRIEDILKERHDSIYVRKLSEEARHKLTIPILTKIHKIVYEKPYDFNPIDWLAAYLRKPLNGGRKYSRYFCSAFVASIYTESDILESHTDWSLVRPSDFSVDDNHLIWSEGCGLNELIQIK